MCVCVWGGGDDDFNLGTKYHHHCITMKIKFLFVSKIDEGVWWVGTHKYRSDETLYCNILWSIMQY